MRTHQSAAFGLAKMRSFNSRAWLLHAMLMASQVVGPTPLCNAVPVRTYDVLDSNNIHLETRQYEDWNNNSAHDPNEKNWLLDTQDSDNDGLVDAREIVWSTDPLNPDSDYDGIKDGDEIDLLGGPSFGYDPLTWDTDLDGYSDHDEYYSYHLVNYNTEGAGSSYFDWDGDGVKNPFDSHPFNNALSEDWNGNGINDQQNSDGDAYTDESDSHPFDPNLWTDWNLNGTNDDQEGSGDSDGDGYGDDNDSHPNDSELWSDWNGNNINDDEETIDSDLDGYYNLNDSHPYNPLLWSDWNFNGVNDHLDVDFDGDGHIDYLDSHPYDSTQWNDWNSDGLNDDQDSDGYNNEHDSHPDNSNLWHDWNNNGYNDEIETIDSDGDNVPDYLDSHPSNPNLWSDRNNNGVNDGEEDPDSDNYPNSDDSHPANRNLYTDWDDDGLNEDQEISLGTNVNNADSDDDGLKDGEEYLTTLTDPNKIDTDGDGLTDFEEVVVYSHLRKNGVKLSPTNKHTWHEFYSDYALVDLTDSDNDGIPNRIENIYAGMNPFDSSDAWGDLDADYINNATEYYRGTRLDGGLNIYDADGDGLSDIQEDYYPSILNKNRSADAMEDFDGDGLFNFEELQIGFHPGRCDTINEVQGSYGHWQLSGGSSVFVVDQPHLTIDGVSPDLYRAPRFGLSVSDMPLSPGDADNDQLPDSWEHHYRKSPGNSALGFHFRDPSEAQQDPDQDGLINLAEYRSGTNPYLANSDNDGLGDADDDTDGDGVSNLVEYLVGTDPKVPQLTFQPSIAAPLPVGSTVNKKILAGAGGVQIGVTPIYEIYKEYVIVDRISAPSQTLPASWRPGTYVIGWSDPDFAPPSGEGGAEGGGPLTPQPTNPDPDAPFGPDDKRRVAFIGVRVRYSGSLIDAGYNPELPLETKVRVVSRSATGSIISTRIESMFTWPGNEYGEFATTELSPSANNSATIEILPEDVNDDPPSGSLSVNDSAGPKYRKVGLNGVPIPDSKPQVQAENGEDEEETYMDALLRQLRHAVSDVYVTAENSLLPLTIRRDSTPYAWSFLSGLSPNEQAELPFGPGWSSSLCSYVRFDNRNAEIMDEMGGRHSYFLLGGNSGVGYEWAHTRQAHLDTKTSYNSFSATPLHSTAFTDIKLVKKFGTTCFYEMVDPILFLQQVHTKRHDLSSNLSTFTYARLKLVRDRLGNELVYEYPDEYSLIPRSISDPARPGHQISIQQADGLVTAVRAPGGETTHYQYSDRTSSISPPAGLGIPGQSQTYKVLTSVVRGDRQVRYDYALTDELDWLPPVGQTQAFHHIELSKITDERNNIYQFAYQLHDTVFTDSLGTGMVQQRGLPMLLTSMTTPIIGTVNVSGVRILKPDPNTAYSAIQPAARLLAGINGTTAWTEINGPAGIYKYIFNQAVCLKPGGNLMATDNPSALNITYAYKKMEIKAPDNGLESYEFDENANLALSKAKDRSGNETLFTYESPTNIPEKDRFFRQPYKFNQQDNGESFSDADFNFDDPVTETRTTPSLSKVWQRKEYEYDATTRMLKKVVVKTSIGSPQLTSTEYAIVNGLRTLELISGQGGHGMSIKHDYFTRVANSTTATERPPYSGFEHYRSVMPELTPLPTNPPVFNANPKDFAVLRSQMERKMAPPIVSGADNIGWWRCITETVSTAPEDTITSTPSQWTTPSVTVTASDFNGNKRSVRDPLGKTTFFTYDQYQQLTKVIYPDGSYKTLEYDLHGNLVQEVDETGRHVFHAYDALNRKSSTTVDLNGNRVANTRAAGDLVTSWTYNARNQILTETDPNGNITTNAYDSIGRLTKVQRGDIETSYEYGANSGGGVFDVSSHKPTKIIDPRGFVTDIEYNGLYLPVKTTLNDTTYTGTTGSDALAKKKVTETTYDAVGRPLTVTQRYNSAALNTTQDQTTTFTYDCLGQVIQTKLPDGTFNHSYYTAQGKPWLIVDAMNRAVTTYYDPAGRPLHTLQPVMDGVRATSSFKYDANGNVIEATDPRGFKTETEYDLRNRAIKVTFPEVTNAAESPPVTTRPATLTAYDSAGRILQVTDPVGATSKNSYDHAGRLTKTTNALGHDKFIAYDSNGNVTEIKDEEGRLVSNFYDEHNRLTKTVTGKVAVSTENVTTRFEYDKGGNRTAVIERENPVGAPTTRFTYDAQNRLRTKVFEPSLLETGTQPTNDTWTYTYDALHKLNEKDPDAAVTTFTYDLGNRVKTMVVPAGTTSGLGVAGFTRTYSYDTAGSIVSVTEGTGTTRLFAAVNYTYDGAGRMKTETSRGLTHTYGYDLSGNVITREYGTGRKTATVYDALNRVVEIAEGKTATFATDKKITKYGYDLAGRSRTLLSPDGQTTLNTYDLNGRVTARLRNSSTGQPVATFAWVYDRAGNVVRQDELLGAIYGEGNAYQRTTQMTYDWGTRLATEKRWEDGISKETTTYAYDASNNRTKLDRVTDSPTVADEYWTYGYNKANQLIREDLRPSSSGTVTAGTNHYYDKNGNRVSSIVDGTNALALRKTFYSWDGQQRLVGVRQPYTTTAKLDTTLTYDYRSRRVGLKQSGGYPTDQHWAFCFSGGLSVAEVPRAISQENANMTAANIDTEYVRGPDMGGGVGGMLYTVQGTTRTYSLSNSRGDIVAQSWNGETLSWRASYNMKGQADKQAGYPVGRQRANSKDEDVAGLLLNEGFRHRDLKTGVWLSRDPAGFVDGPNLYAYVKQNPWTGFDPDGLETSTVTTPIRPWQGPYLNSPGSPAPPSATPTALLLLMRASPLSILLCPGSESLDKRQRDYAKMKQMAFERRMSEEYKPTMCEPERGSAIPAGTPLDAQQKYAREKDSNPAAAAELNNSNSPGGKGAKKALEDVKTYITYVLKDAKGNVSYVGRASGMGTPEQVMKSRLSKGHDIYDLDRTLVPEVIDTQNSADANKGAEKMWYDYYKNNGSPLRNDPQNPPLSNKPSKQQSTQRRVESYMDQDINKQ